MPQTDPDDLPTGHCGHRECPHDGEGCLRISSQHAQPTMWTCPVSVCRCPMLTVEHPSGRRSFEVLNADVVLCGGAPILAPHGCKGFSPN